MRAMSVNVLLHFSAEQLDFRLMQMLELILLAKQCCGQN